MDMRTKYLGLELEHPLIASASPASMSVDGIGSLVDGGAAAVVLHSFFEEQVEFENTALHRFGRQGSNSFAETSSFFPQADIFEFGAEEYLQHLSEARSRYRVPIIASLNGISDTGWTAYAAEMERAGAAAIELNIFWLATDPRLDSRAVEHRYIRIIESVRRGIGIPIAVKLSPYFSSFANFVQRIAETGINGLVLFNRFYQPDIDLTTLEVKPNLELSTPLEIRQGLLWIGVLRKSLSLSLAATSGVHSADEVIKYLLVGADAVMATSSLLHNGPNHMRTMLQGLIDWMQSRGYKSLTELRGSMSQAKVSRPGAYERANYIKMLHSYHSKLSS